MQINAEERGRRLILTVGGREPDMTETEALEADEDVIRISVPPVSAELGSQLFAFYTGITFARHDTLDRIAFPTDFETPAKRMKAAVEQMTKLALGAAELPDEQGGSEAQRIIARERWNAVQSLRWEEGERVCQSALFWNVQGGGLEAVRAVLDTSVDENGTRTGGVPKASALLLKKAGLWDAYTQLATLLDSESGSRIPEPGATPDTSTPSGTEPSDEPSPESGSVDSQNGSEPSTETTPNRAQRRSSRTPSSSGASRSRSGTASPRSTSTSTSAGTTKPRAPGKSARGSGSTAASSD